MAELLTYAPLTFVVAAVLVAVTGRRLGAAILLVAPVLALFQLLSVDRAEPATLEYFTFQLTYLRLDELSAPFAYIFVVATFVAGLYGATLLERHERISALLTAGFALGVVLAGDLLTLFIMWELKAVASAVLIAGSGGGRRSAAQRYLLVHVLGGSLLLGGTVWHLATGGGLAFDAFEMSGPTVLILLSFLLSVAMPPLHAWLPDAYPTASVAGMVFLGIYTTKAAVYALLRGFPGLEILIVLGVAMAIYGVVYAVLENDIRRLLSYHIISQVGFMVAVVGVGTTLAVNGATAHAFGNIVFKGLLIMGAGAIVLATGRSRLSDLGGLWRRMPLVFACTMIGAISIAGVPLFSGFITKELLVYSASTADYSWAVQLLKLASVGTFLSVTLKMMWFAFGAEDRQLAVRPLPVTVSAALVLAAVGNVALGVRPDLLYDLLPHVMDYQPFAIGKISESLQLLTFTGLAFVLLIRRVTPKPALTLDTDWLYRGAPLLVGARLRAARPAGGWAAPVHAAAATVRRRADAAWATVRAPDAPVDTTSSTAVLGAVLLVTFLAVLALGLT